MYRAFGLLLPKNDFDLDAAGARLAAKIAGSTAARNASVVTISKGNWSINIAEVQGAHIPDETVGITDKIAGFERDDVEVLATTDRRIEVWTDDPDPFMEHFNDYLFAVEVLKSFKGVIAVDPAEPALL
ncbi:MAG: hypothetical protein C0467_22395 [Planctomycetaceae bacterium]|nr:hypothetical protein [Planctomycetaceae bacterium]